MDDTTTPAPAPTTELVRMPVWDWPVRVVHWAMVLCLVSLVITGLVKGDAMPWHMGFGRVLLGLVVFRILWGFVGSGNARFGAFVRGPRAAVRYLRSRFHPPHEIHVTHNPAGGWMVVLLLAAMLAQAVLGLYTNDDVLWDGPLAQSVSKDASDLASSVHRRLAWVVVALASLHIVAVVVYLTAFRENLVTAMVGGSKRLPPGYGSPDAARASTAKAIALMIACGVAVWWLTRRVAAAF